MSHLLGAGDDNSNLYSAIWLWLQRRWMLHWGSSKLSWSVHLIRRPCVQMFSAYHLQIHTHSCTSMVHSAEVNNYWVCVKETTGPAACNSHPDDQLAPCVLPSPKTYLFTVPDWLNCYCITMYCITIVFYFIYFYFTLAAFGKVLLSTGWGGCDNYQKLPKSTENLPKTKLL